MTGIYRVLILVFAFLSCRVLAEDVVTLSDAFELRHVSADSNADGETDFHGETSVFSTADRVKYLKNYAIYAGSYFNSPGWDTQAVTDEEVQAALSALKPQPLPAVRGRIPITEWKYLGYRPGQHEEEVAGLQSWSDLPGVEIRNGGLYVQGGKVSISKILDTQEWRMFLSWRVRRPRTDRRVEFGLSESAVIGFGANGEFFFITDGKQKTAGGYEADKWYEFKVEVSLDPEGQGYNFYIDGDLKADFVKLSAVIGKVDSFEVKGIRGLALDDIWGVGYVKAEFSEDSHSRDVPYSIATFIDEDFEIRPKASGFLDVNYDDSAWKNVPDWPYAHGGERHADEDLYLRTRVRVGTFKRANLELETLDPAGEVWVNGEPVAVHSNRHPAKVDLSPFLKPNDENLIAIRVRSFEVQNTMRHTPSDLHTGWFAGRMWLNLTNDRRIDDVFVYTKRLGETAVAQVEVTLRNDARDVIEREIKADDRFEGLVTIKMYPWYPEEGSQAVTTATFPVGLELGREHLLSEEIHVPAARLWTPENPQLYKIVAELSDRDGKVLDDYVVTTGIRTVDQAGGTFRINGEPAMMNGTLLFGFRSPLDRVAQWLRSSPEKELVRDLLAIRKMNGNTARMSHHDGPAGSINDPRYAEIGDQLGIMFQWATTSWVRTGSPWQLDFEGLPKYVRQVRNHPSIVMWQPANHPKFENFEAAMPWFEKVYKTIYNEDTSRLISPTANIGRMKPPNDEGTIALDGSPIEPNPAWTAHRVTRGNMDNATGYGASWESLRKWPYPKSWDGEQGWRKRGFRMDYLNSKERAYFNFENEESIGQPNWSLRKGKPSWRIQSYELRMDEGSIGRLLGVDEWEQSQAWQGFSAYEAIRKMRWLDYDGFAWCTLRGGGNTATYQKPLVDYYGHAKIAYNTVAMAYQPILAGSRNVDMVYGPGDSVPVIVMNLGEARTVEVVVSVQTVEGDEVMRKVYGSVELPRGRSYTSLPPFTPEKLEEGFYAFRYTVMDDAKSN